MRINLNEILYAVSLGLDAAEQELVGCRPGHSKRIAAISIILGKALGLSDNDLIDLAAFSILHDNGLTEVNQEDLEYKKYNDGQGYNANDFNIRRCIVGENNTKFMPFRTNNRSVILLHLENADGSGPFERIADRTPVKAQVIHMANMIDQRFDLTAPTRDTYADIIYFVRSNAGSLFARDIADTFAKAFKQKHLANLQPNAIDNFLRKSTRHFEDEYSFREVKALAYLLAHIVDMKQNYDCKHSTGVAKNAEIMAEYYEFPEEKIVKYYLAGAVHDIGKLMISNSILQKPGKLTDEEFEEMKKHAMFSYEILKNIKNMDDIVVWACHHHEKLDGSGYPFGLMARDLSREERLMTCCDIYQALTEKRAYKDGFSHEKTMEIMRDMAAHGKIDGDIVEDMDHVFANREAEVPDAPTSVLTT